MDQRCPFTREVARELYVERDQTLQVVATACGTTIPTLRKYLRLWGIPARSRGQKPAARV
jgi:hypothetical protein